MRLTLLQKEIIVWLAVLLSFTGAGVYAVTHAPNTHPGMIRLHVIANSDSKADQALKLKVRDAVVEHMEGQPDLDSARQYIEENLTEFEAVSEAVIAAEGYDYPARADLQVSYIPRKSYEDLTLPAGNYEALKITLGRGDGQNWWCVIFPQLCLIGDTQSETADGFGKKILLKSKIKEMMKAEQEEKK